MNPLTASSAAPPSEPHWLSALVWKEARSYWPVTVSLLLVWLAAVLTSVLQRSYGFPSPLSPVTLAVWLMGAHALALTAAAVSEESEHGTEQLLLVAGATRWQVLTGKLFWTTLSTLVLAAAMGLLIAVGQAAELDVLPQRASNPPAFRYQVWFAVGVLLQGGLWGLVGGLLMRQAAAAMVAGTLLWVATAVMLAPLRDSWRGPTAILIPLAVALLLLRRLHRHESAPTTTAVAVPGPARPLAALAWLELRLAPAGLAAVVALALAACLAIALLLAADLPATALSFGAATSPLSIVAATWATAVGFGCGIAVWRGELAQGSLQLLRDCGVQLRTLLAVRCIWWLALGMLLSVIVGVVPANPAAVRPTTYRLNTELWATTSSPLPIGTLALSCALAGFSTGLLAVSLTGRMIYAACAGIPMAVLQAALVLMAAYNHVLPLPLAAVTVLLWPAAWWQSRCRFDGRRPRWAPVAVVLVIAGSLLAQYAVYASYRHFPLPKELARLAAALASEAAATAYTAEHRPAAVEAELLALSKRAGISAVPQADQWQKAGRTLLRFLEEHPDDRHRLNQWIEELQHEPQRLRSPWAVDGLLWHYAAALWLEGHYRTAVSVMDLALAVADAAVRTRATSPVAAAAARIRCLSLIVAMVWSTEAVPEEVLEQLSQTLLARRWPAELIQRSLRASAAESLVLVRRFMPLSFLPCERRRLAALASALLDDVLNYTETIWQNRGIATGPGRLPRLRRLSASRPEQFFHRTLSDPANQDHPLLNAAEAQFLEDLADSFRRAVVASWVAERALRVAVASVAARRYQLSHDRLPTTIADLSVPGSLFADEVLWDVRLSPDGLAPDKARRPRRTSLRFDLVLGTRTSPHASVSVDDPLIWAAGWPFGPAKPVLVYDTDGSPLFVDRLLPGYSPYAVAAPLKPASR